MADYGQNTKSSDLEAKTTPVDADGVLLSDSEDATVGKLKFFSWANLLLRIPKTQHDTTSPAHPSYGAIGGTVDGLTSSFTLSKSHILGTLEIYVGGVREVDFTETSGNFQLGYNPTSGVVITTTYQSYS